MERIVKNPKGNRFKIVTGADSEDARALVSWFKPFGGY
jgi:hypothetical protein